MEGDPYLGRAPYPLDELGPRVELGAATENPAVRVDLRGVGRVRTKWV
jgi:hypothetical protein